MAWYDFYGLIEELPSGVQPPLNSLQWPNPSQGPAFHIQLRTWTGQYNKLLIGKDKLPFRKLDWPLTPAPVRGKGLGTWLGAYNKNLIGKDKLPFRGISDLPPQPPLFANSLRTWLGPFDLLLFTQPVQRPFVETDWPLPQSLPRPNYSFTNSYNKNLISQDKLPFRQDDWPLTPAAPRGKYEWTGRPQWYLQTPFRQTDWPLPARGPALIYGFTAAFNRNLITVPRPFVQTNWPLTRRADDGYRSWTFTNRALYAGGVVTNVNINEAVTAADQFSVMMSKAQLGLPPAIRDWWDRDPQGSLIPGAGYHR